MSDCRARVYVLKGLLGAVVNREASKTKHSLGMLLEEGSVLLKVFDEGGRSLAWKSVPCPEAVSIHSLLSPLGRAWRVSVTRHVERRKPCPATFALSLGKTPGKSPPLTVCGDLSTSSVDVHVCMDADDGPWCVETLSELFVVAPEVHE